MIDDDAVALERAGWASLVDGTGSDFYGRVLTDDALLVVPGMVMAGAEWVASMAGPQWSRYELGEMRVVDLGADAVAVVYEATALRDDVEYAAHFTSAYRRVDGEWRLALHQQTPSPS